MSEKIIGTVKWFNTSKGFGFISVPDQPDIFIHYQDIKSDGFKNLIEGQKVTFEIQDGPKGKRAANVDVAP